MKKNKLLILTALKAEASPFIDHYKLRKKEFIGSKFIYYSKTIALLITGVGKTNVQNTLESYIQEGTAALISSQVSRQGRIEIDNLLSAFAVDPAPPHGDGQQFIVRNTAPEKKR